MRLGLQYEGCHLFIVSIVIVRHESWRCCCGQQDKIEWLKQQVSEQQLKLITAGLMRYYVILFICLSIMFHCCTKLSESTSYSICSASAQVFCPSVPLNHRCRSFRSLLFTTLFLSVYLWLMPPLLFQFFFLSSHLSISICICCPTPPPILCVTVSR